MDGVEVRADEGVVEAVLANGLLATVRTDEAGVFTGEITQVRPGLGRRAAPGVAREGLIVRRDPAVLRPEAQRIDRSAHPDWPTAAEGEPQPGDGVYCTAGWARVLRVLGKTGNGSRLLELRLPGEPKSSFFAAASNVLLEPRVAPAEGDSTPVLIG